MIYLVDDKKIRQEKDYSWDKERFLKYKEHIIPIYTDDDLKQKQDGILKEGNIVLYHESFFNGLNSDITNWTKKMQAFANTHTSFLLVIFSGSKNTRKLDKNIAHIPDSIFYGNLEYFMHRYMQSDIRLEYLCYGQNPDIEKELLMKWEEEQKKHEHSDSIVLDNQTSLFIQTLEKYINPISGATIADFYEEESDIEITTFIKNNLERKKYDNIFIPLCYGNSLSDFNGLKLALHIRCTKSINQLSRLILYGYVDSLDMINNEYFNILKTKNIQYISYNYQAFEKLSNKPNETLLENELSKEMCKLKLEVPTHYEDNHDIANEWGIYQIARNANVDIKKIEGFSLEKLNTLYFKWLIVKNGLQQKVSLEQEKQQLKYSNKLAGPKLKGKIDLNTIHKRANYLLIDDRANFGWKGVIEKAILKENNVLEVATTKEEAYNKLSKHYDLIFLDLRLSKGDSIINTPYHFSSFEILKNIRNDFTSINFSTPIILLTASNKIWNIDHFKEYGVDAFYIKEHPDFIFSIDQSIENFNKLQKDFLDLIDEGKKRNKIWDQSIEIYRLLDQHRYFNVDEKEMKNIKRRIEDKLKLGYAQMFTATKTFEKETLLLDKEPLAFIIYWSIIEEVVKAYTNFSTAWDDSYRRKEEWMFKNNNYFIQYDEDSCLYKKNHNKREPIEGNESQFRNISISDQVYGLLYAYSDNHQREELCNKFKSVNQFRNSVDYIHSSVKNILTLNLIDKNIQKRSYDMSLTILDFIASILKLG